VLPVGPATPRGVHPAGIGTAYALPMTRITIIAAVGRNGVIGRDGRMPWHLPEDFAHFKAATLGHALVMGRRTFESIGRALPGRRTIVITRDPGWHHSDVEVAHSFEEALSLAGVADEVFVAGGAEVYAAPSRSGCCSPRWTPSPRATSTSRRSTAASGGRPRGTRVTVSTSSRTSAADRAVVGGVRDSGRHG
jgi:hypothetical protein